MDTSPSGWTPAQLEEPPADVTDPYELLVRHLEWFRAAVFRKIDGLTDEQLRTPVAPFGWAPLGLVQHLGWVERRWLRWGFAAEQVIAYPSGGDTTEWGIDGAEPTGSVLAFYHDECERARRIVAGHALDDPAAVGGRFPSAEQAPSLGRILVHLLQEYARHLGHLDAAREIVDGATGE